MQTTRGASLNDLKESGTRGGTRVGVLIGVAAIALTLDIVSKSLVVTHLEGRAPAHVIGGLLQVDVTRNSGAAFSFGAGLTIIFTVIAAAVIVAILRTARRLRSLPWAVALGLLLGGAMGNLTDRVFRSPGIFRGWVVDWIQLPHWPIFNLADSAIVCGGVVTVIIAFLGVQLDGSRDRGARGGKDAPSDTTDAKDTVDTTAGREGTDPDR
jgi:signal peptidase II